MALVNSSGFSHLRLNVTDIHRSKEFYDTVFGWPVIVDRRHVVDEGLERTPENIYGGVIYMIPAQYTLLILRPVDSEKFDQDRTGLDHVSFSLATRADLEAAETALSEAKIEHGEIIDLEDGRDAILSFQDPDNINLELTSPIA